MVQIQQARRATRRGQSIFMVMAMLIIAILMALFYWFNAGSQYAQAAQSAARAQGDIFGRTLTDAVTNGIGRQAAEPQFGGPLPPGVIDFNSPGTVPPLGPPVSQGGPPGTGGGLPVPPSGPGGTPQGPGGTIPGAGGPGVQTTAGSGNIRNAPWMESLYRTLRQNLEAVPGQDLPGNIDIAVAELGTELNELAGLKDEAGRPVQVQRLTAKIKKIQRTLTMQREGIFTKDNYYKEPAFKDGDRVGGDFKDVEPRDFVAEIEIDFGLRAGNTGGAANLNFRRVMNLRVTDVAPVAREFAIFAYEPPHTEEFMVKDLNGPGFMSVIPNAVGRIFVRGPYVVLTEDAGAQAGLGGPVRSSASGNQPQVNWPSQGDNNWHAFGGVPTPRAVNMPVLCASPEQMWDAISEFVSGDRDFTDLLRHPPQRPLANDSTLTIRDPIDPEVEAAGLNEYRTFGSSTTILGIFHISWPRVWTLGIVPDLKPKMMGNKWNLDTAGALAGFAGLYQPLPPRHSVTVSGSSSYFTGLAEPGKQKFSITGLSPTLASRVPGTSAATGSLSLVNPYRGLLIPKAKDDENLQIDRPVVAVGVTPDGRLPKFSSGAVLTNLTQGGTATVATQEDDFLSHEPAHYPAAPGGTPTGGTNTGPGTNPYENAGSDQGIYGLYGIANYERIIIWNFDLIELANYAVIVSAMGAVFTGGASLGFTAAIQAAKTAAQAALRKLATKIAKIPFTFSLLPMNYKVKVPKVPDLNRWNPADLSENITIAPYGLYNDAGKTNFWKDEGFRALAMAGTGIGLSKILNRIFKGGKNAADDAAAAASKQQTKELSGTVAKNADDSITTAVRASDDAASTVARNADDIASGAAREAGALQQGLSQAQASARSANASFASNTRWVAEADRAFAAARQARLSLEQQGINAVSDTLRNQLSAARAAESAAEALLNSRTLQRDASRRAMEAARATVAQLQDEVAQTGAAAATQTIERTAAAQADDVVNATAATQGSRVGAALTRAKSFISTKLSSFRLKNVLSAASFPGIRSFAGQVIRAVGTALKAGGIGKRFAIGYMGLAQVLPRSIFDGYYRGNADSNRVQLAGSTVPSVYTNPAPAASQLLQDFPKGYLPPKYRFFPNVQGQRFATMADLLRSQNGNDINKSNLNLLLSGVILVEDLNYDNASQTITYKGRGIIVGVPRPGQAAQVVANVKFTPKVLSADNESYLTLVYEMPVAEEVTQDKPGGMLELGEVFVGSVVSTQGVKPAGRTTVIHGNLVCRHINKSAIGDDDKAVIVNYSVQRMNDFGWDNERWWTSFVSHKVSAFTSEPPQAQAAQR